jgi:hypothetical protein
MEDCVWYVPFGSADGHLQSAYEADAAAAIASAQPFTVSLQTVHLSHGHRASLLERLLRHGRDFVILTYSTLGAKPKIQRVHYYAHDVDPAVPMSVHDLLSDVIYLCDDYSGKDHLYVELHAMMIDTGSENAATADAFRSLASTVGAVFPIMLPYTALADGVVNALDKFFGGGQEQAREELLSPLELRPPGTRDAKTLQQGRYVVFPSQADGKQSAGVDGTQYRLLENDQLARQDGTVEESISYAVFRIDPVSEPSLDVDSVVAQRVATLLTGLNNDRTGASTDPVRTSLGFLQDTLTAYTNFTDLQRYQQLANKPQRTPAEQTLMDQLAKRPELQPFLPKQPSAS